MLGTSNAVSGGAKPFGYIFVTYPAGSSVTCTKGSTTLSAENTSGQWVFAIPEAGAWTVAATDGTNTKSESVSITAEGQSVSVELSYQLVLFDGANGGDVTSLTGGWAMYGHDSDYHSSSVTSNSLYFAYTDTASSTHTWAFNTIKAIDISKYKTLYVDVSSVTGGGNIHIAKNASATDSYDASASANGGIASLDVSSFNGSYYIGLGFGPTKKGDMKATKVWLE